MAEISLPLHAFFALTEFLTVKATEWVRYIYFHWNAQVTNFDKFWNRSSTEGNYEGVSVAFITRIVFGQYIMDVSDALCLELIENFFLGAINESSTSYDAFAGVGCAVWAVCYRTAIQTVQFF